MRVVIQVLDEATAKLSAVLCEYVNHHYPPANPHNSPQKIRKVKALIDDAQQRLLHLTYEAERHAETRCPECHMKDDCSFRPSKPQIIG